jgi:predicted metallopeptidase
MIRYELARDLRERIVEILKRVKMTHIDASKVTCLRSEGSRSRRTIARCHGLPKIMQLALNRGPHYVIEVISERFDTLSREDQTRVLIHELMHIPHSFGGGFRSHRPYVTRQKVEKVYQEFLRAQ